MAHNAEQLSRLNANYEAVTGRLVQRFVCPITLRDEPDAVLCDGHVLNDAIDTARRRTVVQRADVDCFFGRTIEPELVTFLNAGIAPYEQLMRLGGHILTVKLPSGEKVPAFFANSKARARFP